jgi:SAM-dependent methyltransferase
MEYVKCDICGSDDYHVVAEKGRFGLNVRNVICRQCGLVYVNPRMDEGESADFYSKKYRKLHFDTESPTEAYAQIDDLRAKDRMRFLEDHVSLPPQGYVLDIGSSTGAYLSHLSDRGWAAFGIEPDINFSEFARTRYGLNVFTGMLEEADLREDFFDLIIALHVLEHFRSPKKSLGLINRKLKQGGLLFVEIPNLDKPLRGKLKAFFSNVHFYSFSKNTITELLQMTGFQILWIQETGFMTKDSDFNLRIIARKDSNGKGKVGEIKGEDYREILNRLKKRRRRYFLLSLCGDTWDFTKKLLRMSIQKVLGNRTHNKLLHYLRRIKYRQRA